MSLRFLTPGADVAAFSPLHGDLEAAGAAFEQRDGWQIPVRVGAAGDETRALAEAVGWADRSALAKLELHASINGAPAGGASADGVPGQARQDGLDWWCAVTRERTLVIAEPDRHASLQGELEQRFPGRVLDVTTQYGALLLAGPAARETIARFCAIDLRPQVSPPGSFRPGSVARTPGAILVEAPERYLLLFGAAVAGYVWTVVSDAGAGLGGRPVGVDAVRAAEVALDA